MKQTSHPDEDKEEENDEGLQEVGEPLLFDISDGALDEREYLKEDGETLFSIVQGFSWGTFISEKKENIYKPL